MNADDPASRLTERYDREARAYRKLWAPVLRRAALVLLPGLAGGGVRRVLDVGTGVGALLPDLARAFPGAFDPSPVIHGSYIGYGIVRESDIVFRLEG